MDCYVILFSFLSFTNFAKVFQMQKSQKFTNKLYYQTSDSIKIVISFQSVL